jgi:hypothetical protein
VMDLDKSYYGLIVSLLTLITSIYVENSSRLDIIYPILFSIIYYAIDSAVLID